MLAETRPDSRDTVKQDALPRRAVPIKWWAAVGVTFLALEVYVFAAWILNGEAQRTPTGATPVPGYMRTIATLWQGLGLVALVVFAVVVVIRPWRRDGRISTNGLFGIVFLTLFWQDPFLNYFQTFMTYNAVMVNFGSWAPNMPGWIAPRGQFFAEPIIWIGPIFVYVVCTFVFLGSGLMSRLKARRPQMGMLGRIILCFAFLAGFDLLFEPFMMLTGLYSFPGAIRRLSLFAGHYYQFPVYEALFWGATWTAWASLHHFRDDKGMTFAERGADRLSVSGRARTGVRLLALIGACNAIFMVGYNVPHAIVSLYADDWPRDIATRSYLTNQICGEGTDYACSGPQVPIPRRSSMHLAPDLKTLVRPPQNTR